MKRTYQEIIDQINYLKEGYRDLFGAQIGDLIEFLPYENAKQFLNDEVIEADWIQKTDVAKAAKDYLPFAWSKANDCRGISSGRSIDHMEAYLWLSGADSEMLSGWRDANYQYYGKPLLVCASEFFGFDWKSVDDGRWSNDEDSESISNQRKKEAIKSARDDLKIEASI